MEVITVHVISWGIATEIMGAKKISIDLEEGSTIAHAKEYLLNKFPKFRDLAHLSFAIDEEYRADGYFLKEKDEIQIIPPVSGG